MSEGDLSPRSPPASGPALDVRQGYRFIVNAHRINQGQMPEATPAGTERSDFYIVDAAEPEIAAAKILAAVRDRIPRAFGLDPVRDVQLLCPMSRGGVGARSLNIELQKVLNQACPLGKQRSSPACRAAG